MDDDLFLLIDIYSDITFSTLSFNNKLPLSRRIAVLHNFLTLFKLCETNIIVLPESDIS